jgi:hypothetical protein
MEHSYESVDRHVCPVHNCQKTYARGDRLKEHVVMQHRRSIKFFRRAGSQVLYSPVELTDVERKRVETAYQRDAERRDKRRKERRGHGEDCTAHIAQSIRHQDLVKPVEGLPQQLADEGAGVTNSATLSPRTLESRRRRSEAMSGQIHHRAEEILEHRQFIHKYCDGVIPSRLPQHMMDLPGPEGIDASSVQPTGRQAGERMNQSTGVAGKGGARKRSTTTATSSDDVGGSREDPDCGKRIAVEMPSSAANGMPTAVPLPLKSCMRRAFEANFFFDPPPAPWTRSSILEEMKVRFPGWNTDEIDQTVDCIISAAFHMRTAYRSQLSTPMSSCEKELLDNIGYYERAGRFA